MSLPPYLHTYLPTTPSHPLPANLLLLTFLPSKLKTYLTNHLPTKPSTLLPTHLPTYLPTYLPACLPTCLHTSSHVYLPAYIPAPTSTYLHICLPTVRSYLHTCLLICRWIYLHTYPSTYLMHIHKDPSWKWSKLKTAQHEMTHSPKVS